MNCVQKTAQNRRGTSESRAIASPAMSSSSMTHSSARGSASRLSRGSSVLPSTKRLDSKLKQARGGGGGARRGHGGAARKRNGTSDARKGQPSVRNLLEKHGSLRLELHREFAGWVQQRDDPDLVKGSAADLALLQNSAKTRSKLHEFLSFVTKAQMFDNLVMLAIFVNVIVIALEPSVSDRYSHVFEAFDLVFLTIYTLEFVLKVYVEPLGYWRNGYNRFDFLVLLLSYMEYQPFFEFDGTLFQVFRALRALRALRSISFIRSLQVIVSALIRTTASIANVLMLLFLLMYIFAIVGVYFLGDLDPTYWNTVGRGLYTLFALVTGDGWTFFQDRLDEENKDTRIYTVLFFFLGNMIFTNLFIGIVIENLEASQEEEQQYQSVKRIVLTEAKKSYLAARQKTEVMGQLHGMDDDVHLRKAKFRTDQQVYTDISSIREDMVQVDYLSCGLSWMETFYKNMQFWEHNAFRMQQLHFGLADTLAAQYLIGMSSRSDGGKAAGS